MSEKEFLIYLDEAHENRYGSMVRLSSSAFSTRPLSQAGGIPWCDMTVLMVSRIETLFILTQSRLERCIQTIPTSKY